MSPVVNPATASTRSTTLRSLPDRYAITATAIWASPQTTVITRESRT